MKKTVSALSLLLASGSMACSSAEEATLELNAYGEGFIEEGIPADDMADGWGIVFSSFEVGFAEVVVAGHDFGEFEVDLSEPSEGKGHVLDSAEVPAAEIDDASFTMTRVAVSGTATKEGEEEKSFSWVFAVPVAYGECEPGPTLVAGEAGSFQITVHADHLFYDSLVSEEPALRFQALADADGDDDGVITQAELEAADIGLYDPGSAGEATNLWAFLSAQATTLAHVNGEGHCHGHPVEE